MKISLNHMEVPSVIRDDGALFQLECQISFWAKKCDWVIIFTKVAGEIYIIRISVKNSTSVPNFIKNLQGPLWKVPLSVADQLS
ncbi:hypothetical protein L596_012725 [Steinernema carpocapsae]|uniref:Uncharacterized protein n=1 Tax=Steinernema carpocapsae TaxID=34508 RepID=A0A4U5NYU4_STECR|nr:hypothetical protein L596_012725 [Steinernema carpocapsae]